MSDQSIFLDWKTDTSQVDQAARKAQTLNTYLAHMKDTTNAVAVASARASSGIQEAGNKSTGAAISIMAMANAIDDAQYGFRGVVNNIPMILAGLGVGTGLAGVAMIAGVAVNQLANNWDKLTGSLGHSESAMQRTTRLLKEMGDGVKNPLQMANQQVLLDRQQDLQRGRSTFDQLRRGEGADPELGKIAGELVKEALKPGVMESLAMRRSVELMNTDATLASLYKKRDAFPEDSNSWDWAQTDVNKRKGRVLDFAQMEIGNIIAEVQAGKFDNLPILQRHLDELGVGGDIKGQAEAAKAGNSLKIQDAMDDAYRAVLEGRQKEAEQIQERVRWEAIRNDAEQNVARAKLDAEKAELARMDQRPIMDRMADASFGGGANNPFFAQMVAGGLRQRRLAGANDIEARVGVQEQIAKQLFANGMSGNGPIMTVMEARQQAARMVQQAAPETAFLGEQMNRLAGMQPDVVRSQEVLAAQLLLARQQGIPAILGRRRR